MQRPVAFSTGQTNPLRDKPVVHLLPGSGQCCGSWFVTDWATRACAILVEYGPVPIADKKLMRPVRSLAPSSAPVGVNTSLEGVATEKLNLDLLTDYHMFPFPSRILNEQSTASALSSTPISASAVKNRPSPVAGSRHRTRGATRLRYHGASPPQRGRRAVPAKM
jgi:hypothetical protein